MNLFYASLDNRINKFKVYNVHTMADEFMVVAGMPNRIGWSPFQSDAVVFSMSGVVNVITLQRHTCYSQEINEWQNYADH